MNKIIVFAGLSALIINTLAGIVFPAYQYFNMVLNDVILLVGMGIAISVNVKIRHDACRISLMVINAVLCVFQFCIGLMTGSGIVGNWGIPVIVALILCDILICLTVNHFYKYA